jgi:hypothetical protein
VLVGVAVTIMLLGAAAFSIADHVSYGIGLYWAVTARTRWCSGPIRSYRACWTNS